MTLAKDEFVENPVYELVASRGLEALSHIALKADHLPLCNRKLKSFERLDLFVDEFLCYKCERIYKNERRVIRIEYNGVYILGEDNPPELGRVIYGF